MTTDTTSVRPVPTRRSRPALDDVGIVAAASLLACAAVHTSVLQAHLAEWRPAGYFFLTLAVAQALLALLVVRGHDRRVLVAVVGVNGAALATWAVSRTAGLPIGPDHVRAPEAVGPSDLLCVGLELAAVVLVVVQARGWRPRPAGAGPTWRAAGAVVLVLGLTSGVVLAGAAGPEHHTEAADHEH